MTTLDEKFLIATDVAQRLGSIVGVKGVTLGGSLARGRATPNSDIDLGIFYQPERPPDLEALRQLAAKLDDAGSGASVTRLGEWGPWINGGAWLTVKGQRLDWLYRDLDKITEVVTACKQGSLGRYVQPGHPHGFHTHIYLAELHYGRILHDPTGVLARLKAQLDPYPEPLKRALIDTFLWQAGFALDVSEKSVQRGESAYVAGCFFECVFDLVQVLYALNERYYMNEKGAVGEMIAFEHLPKDFTTVAHEVLGQLGPTTDELTESLKRLRALLADVTALVTVASR